MRAGWVGLAEQVAVLAEEFGRRLGVVGEFGEDGPQGGALDPVEHRVLAGEQLEVGGLPGVRRAAEVGEAQQVVGRVQDVYEAPAVAVEAVAPARGLAQFAEERVAGGGEVAGDLEGERAAGGEGVDPVREGFGVARDPLECGVGDDQVVRLVGGPVCGVRGRKSSRPPPAVAPAYSFSACASISAERS